MTLYTFLFDFKGGTYISQVMSTSILDAIQQWASKLDADAIADFSTRHKEAVMNEVVKYRRRDYAAVENLLNVWCFDVAPCDEFGIIHIVRTSTDI